MTETDMAMDEDARNAGALGRIAGLALALTGALFACGIVAGIIAGHAEDGGGAMSVKLIAILAGTGALAALCVYFSYRGLRAMLPGRGAPPRDRRNMLTMLVVGALGIGIAIVMLMAETSPAMFGSDPIPAGFAIALALLIGVFMPMLSIYWHLRVVDEQEAAAYNKGALFAMYAFWIGAPVWWLLWRGGLVPAPDGILIYFITAAVACVVWFWAKYR